METAEGFTLERVLGTDGGGSSTTAASPSASTDCPAAASSESPAPSREATADSCPPSWGGTPSSEAGHSTLSTPNRSPPCPTGT